MYKLPPGARAALDAADLEQNRLQDCPPEIALDLLRNTAMAIQDGYMVDVITMHAPYGDEVCLVVAHKSADDRLIGGWYVEQRKPIKTETFMNARTLYSAVHAAIRDRKKKLRNKHANPWVWIVGAIMLVPLMLATIYIRPMIEPELGQAAFMVALLLSSYVALYWLPLAITRTKRERAWRADKEAQSLEALLK